MTEFVRDLEAELLAAARRRARRPKFVHPPALLVAALVAAALLVVALTPRGGTSPHPTSGNTATASSCLFPDVTHLLRDGPCPSNPFRP
jgi:hypothetical protein